MRTDELADDFDVDRALRDLLPAMPRSRAWETTKRDELLAFISTGISSATPSTATDDGAEIAVRSVVTDERKSRPMRRVLVGIAAAVALFAGLAPRWLSTDPGDDAPDTGASGESTVPLLPDLAEPSLRPDRFPLISPDSPLAAAATANYGGQIGWDNPASADALVARLTGNVMTDAIQLRVLSSFDSSTLSITSAEAINVAGTDMKLYVEGGTQPLKTVVLPGTPTLTATGLDPVSFLASAGGFPIVGSRVGADGEVTFAVDGLPDGYDVVVPPSRLPLGAFDARTHAPDGDGADGIAAWVQVSTPLAAYAISGDLQRVDINGVSGWMRDEVPGSTVLWQVSPTTWAYIGGANTVDVAVAFARSLTFVDEATWRSHFDVPEPDFLTKEQALQPAPSTLPEPTVLIVDRRTIQVDTPDVTPINCGDTPYTNNTVTDPVTALSPEQALAAFLSSPSTPRLFQLGYEEISIVSAGTYRYERRNNIGALTTIVFVEPVDNAWAATRWQASPC